VASLFNECSKALAELLNGEVFPAAAVAPLGILAIDALEGAMGEEEGATALGAREGWFLAEVWPPTEHSRIEGAAAVATLAFQAVDVTLTRAKRTSCKRIHRD
jgi:hypothetical protein